MFHSAVLIRAVHQYTVEFFGDDQAAATPVWSLKMAAMMLGINISVVQMFFCLRVYLITRSLVLAVITTTLALARFVIHIRQMVTMFSATTLAVVTISKFRWEVTSLLTVGAASDVLVAASICWALLRIRSGFASSDKLVDKLVAFTIGTLRDFRVVLW
ncbi:hypothetical protein EXIGLDRAFT_776857 [Exidia glandulosa HHB12029]|uniref:Uncharacterized protein n=1 Tax=Exidia glandulosa HHB12029 TaxID=1314781 RepID=A0A165ZMR9_EXIGL|nr:hypothetical protein EXIGLDRAFT_776857 [Exidia glandulosa HHB12029]